MRGQGERAEIRPAEARLPNRLINRRRIGDLSERGAVRKDAKADMINVSTGRRRERERE